MQKALKPNECLESIHNIDFDRLKEKGINALIFDIDDTIIPRREKLLNPLLYNFFEELKEKGFRILFLSNNLNKKRAGKIASEFNVPLIIPAFKPFPFGYQKALKQLGAKNTQAAMIGDQLFMDVLGGNLAGIYTILVKPISLEIKWYRQLMRKAEEYFLSKLMI